MAHTIRGRLIYILLQEGNVVGSWSNLKQLCDAMSEKENFISYSKLSKEVAEYRRTGNHTPLLSFTSKDGKPYSIQIDMLQ